MQKPKKLPIGIQTFANLIKEGYLYVDNDFHALKQTLQAFFSSIPHDWYQKNRMAMLYSKSRRKITQASIAPKVLPFI